jgi:phage host-nuclease inhibitor protein Gam
MVRCNECGADKPNVSPYKALEQRYYDTREEVRAEGRKIHDLQREIDRLKYQASANDARMKDMVNAAFRDQGKLLGYRLAVKDMQEGNHE